MANNHTPSYEAVKKVIDSIIASGKKPSVTAICKILHISDQAVKYAVYRHFIQWEEDKLSLAHEKDEQIPENNIYAKKFYELKSSFEERTKEMENSLALVRATLESTADGILMVGRNGKMLNWNQKFVDLMKFPKELLDVGDETESLKYVFSQLKEGEAEALYRVVNELWDDLEGQGDIGEMHFKDGRILERYSQPHRIGKEVVGRVWSFRDITQRRKMEETLRLRERAIEASPHGVVITAPEFPYIITDVNPAFTRITGYKTEEAIGKPFDFLAGKDVDQLELKNIHIALKERKEKRVILRNYRKDGKLFWNEIYVAPVLNTEGAIQSFVGIFVDATQRKEMEDQLIYLATHDNLTDLPNRSLLNDRLQQAIIHAKRNNTLVSVMFLDLDYFKNVNDSLGHSAGDQVLNTVAKRLRSSLSEIDTLARIGGDEFVIICTFAKKTEDVMLLAQHILTLFNEPFVFNEQKVILTTSIGISFYPMDGENVETLMKNADMAMYQAKELGRNSFKFYTEELNQRLLQRLELENGLRRALEKQEFRLLYQPLVDLKTSTIIGFEALLRWETPDGKIVTPDRFIKLSEDNGLIIPMGEWVLRTGCQQIKNWQKQGLPRVVVAINVSIKQLIQPGFFEMVKRVLAETKLDGEFLELELTESIFVENSKQSLTTLDNLHKLGVKLVIDDFGTGYSCLSYLHQLPVNKLKIDISFVRTIKRSDDRAPLVETIIALARNLKLQVLAEGVETIEQVNYLINHNCDEAQGYYFGKPMKAENCLELLQKNPKLV